MTDNTACLEAAARVYPYLDGELTWVRRAKIRWHLRSCTRCEAAFVFEQHLQATIKSGLSEDVGDDVLDRLKSFLRDNDCDC